MSYCLNPTCPKPENPGDANFCQACGDRLLLGKRYRALQVLGQGGFGRTFLAVDETSTDKPFCVIKQFLPQTFANFSTPRTSDFFKQEVDRLEQLGDHPQIPALLDHIQDESGQYLIQEFIDGENLETVLQQEGTFSESRIRKVLNDLLPVLRFIHQHQVIHRDIKPENIICPKQGNALALVDFGASKYATGTALARTGTVIGSAGYVAPEQAMGKAEFSSDLYSLGITCIHLLTGLHPFDLYSVSEDRWVWKDYLTQPINDRLRRVLDKMLQRATSQRYATADAVLEDLSLASRLSSKTTRSITIPARTSSSQKGNRSTLPIAPPAPDWQLLHTLVGHTGAVTATAIDFSGNLLASGSVDKTIKLWHLKTGELLHTFAGRSLWSGSGHSDRITTLAFTTNGKMLISGSDDGTIKEWDLDSQKLDYTFSDHGWGISAIALSPTGKLLVSGGSDGVISLWDRTKGDLIADLTKHQEFISALVLHPNGRMLASASHDQTIRLWDLRTQRLLNTLKGHTESISAIALTPDWQTVISASWDSTLKAWDLEQGQLLQTMAGHRDRIHCLAIDPAGKLLASGGEDAVIKLWEVQENDSPEGKRHPKRIARLRDSPLLRHSWGINSLTYSPNGRLLVSGSTDETIKVWQR